MLNFNKKKPISNIPFFYSDNVLKQDFYEKLSNSFPKEEDAVNEPTSFQNSRIRIRRENLKKFLIQNYNWQKLYEYLNSEEFIRYVFDLFGDDYDKKKYTYNNKNKLFDLIDRYIFKKKILTISTDISLSGLKYFNDPHIDRRYRKYILLIYFCDRYEEKIQGGELVFHSIKNNNYKTIRDDRFYDKDDLKEIATIPPINNSAVIFKNNSKAIHSVNEITSIVGKRKFCYVSIDVQ